MVSFIKLTRPLNLFIVALTMWVMWWWLLRSICAHNGIGLTMENWQFICLTLAVVLITAGGNVINDYFDQQIDKVNKPDKVIVGRFVKRRVAMGGHIILSGLGIVLGTLVSFSIGKPIYSILFLATVGILWWYSTNLKRLFLVGNITVALLSALVPLIVGLFEIPALRVDTIDLLLIDMEVEAIETFFTELWYWVLGYALFAFIGTLVRELQKDMADVPGDKAAGCQTAPIVLGFSVARYLSLFQHLLLLVGLLVLRKLSWFDNTFSYYYIGIAVILPVMISAGLTVMAEHRKQFVWAGMIIKLAMVTAILYAFFLGNEILK